jgi:hypothetical protein
MRSRSQGLIALAAFDNLDYPHSLTTTGLSRF